MNELQSKPSIKIKMHNNCSKLVELQFNVTQNDANLIMEETNVT